VGDSMSMTPDSNLVATDLDEFRAEVEARMVVDEEWDKHGVAYCIHLSNDAPCAAYVYHWPPRDADIREVRDMLVRYGIIEKTTTYRWVKA